MNEEARIAGNPAVAAGAGVGSPAGAEPEPANRAVRKYTADAGRPHGLRRSGFGPAKRLPGMPNVRRGGNAGPARGTVA